MNGNVELHELTQSSINLAEAASNYGALKVIFGVFLCVFLLMVLVYIYQILATQKRLAVISSASEKVLKYFTELSEHTIGKEEAKMIIGESIGKSEALAKYYILKIRLENHTDNKEFTTKKIRSLVDNDVSSRRIFLSRFQCVGHSMSFTVTDDDSKAIVSLINEWVYKDDKEFTVSLMAQAVNLYYDGVRIKAQAKVDNVADV